MSHISKSKFFRIVRCLQRTYLYEDTYSYQSKQIRTPSSLSGVIVACPSRSNSSLPLILADTLPLGKHFFPFGFLISYAYDASIVAVVFIVCILTSYYSINDNTLGVAQKYFGSSKVLDLGRHWDHHKRWKGSPQREWPRKGWTSQNTLVYIFTKIHNLVNLYSPQILLFLLLQGPKQSITLNLKPTPVNSNSWDNRLSARVR